MWPFTRKQKQPQEGSASPVLDPSIPAPDVSADELLIQSIESFRAQMRAVETRTREQHLDAIADAQKTIEYSNQFIRRAGLDAALLSMLKEMWHWPAWIKRSDFADHRIAALAELSADETERGNGITTKRISFRFASQSYRFEFDEDRSFFDDCKWGAIRLYGNDELVIAIKIYHRLDVDQDYDDWNYQAPTVFKPGAWIGPIIELEHEFRLARQKWFQDRETQRLTQQAEGLPNPK